MSPKYTSPMIRHLAVTKFRTQLNSVIRRINRDKEYVILERAGMPVAAVMDIDEFEDYLELNDPRAQRDIEISRKEFEAGKGRPARELLSELEEIAAKS